MSKTLRRTLDFDPLEFRDHLGSQRLPRNKSSYGLLLLHISRVLYFQIKVCDCLSCLPFVFKKGNVIILSCRNFRSCLISLGLSIPYNNIPFTAFCRYAVLDYMSREGWKSVEAIRFESLRPRSLVCVDPRGSSKRLLVYIKKKLCSSFESIHIIGLPHLNIKLLLHLKVITFA